MTLLDFEELTAYWAEHPPVHILVAAYLGLGKQKQTRLPSRMSGEASSGYGNRTDSDVGSILAELGPGFASGNVHADLAPASSTLRYCEANRPQRPSKSHK
jgi:hypothetical protein